MTIRLADKRKILQLLWARSVGVMAGKGGDLPGPTSLRAATPVEITPLTLSAQSLGPEKKSRFGILRHEEGPKK